MQFATCITVAAVLLGIPGLLPVQTLANTSPCSSSPCPSGQICVNQRSPSGLPFSCACPQGFTGINCTTHILRTCYPGVYLGLPEGKKWWNSEKNGTNAEALCKSNGGTVPDESTFPCASAVARANPQFTRPPHAGVYVHFARRSHGDRERIIDRAGNTRSVKTFSQSHPQGRWIQLRTVCVWKMGRPPIVDGCSSNPCQNNATCIPGQNLTFTCRCARNFFGPTCDILSFKKCANGARLGFPKWYYSWNSHVNAPGEAISLCKNQGATIPEGSTVPCAVQLARRNPSFTKPGEGGILVDIPGLESPRLLYGDTNTLTTRKFRRDFNRFPRIRVVCAWKQT